MHLSIKQPWVERANDNAVENFKLMLVYILNQQEVYASNRWHITRISEGDAAYLLCDEKAFATLKIDGESLDIDSIEKRLLHEDDLMFAIRYTASKNHFAVYSRDHGDARLPLDYMLALDHTSLWNDKEAGSFFKRSDFEPRYAMLDEKIYDDGTRTSIVGGPFYGQHKQNGTIHILNDIMMTYLWKKENQSTNGEFSYKVADSLSDFAKKYDFGLVPTHFYQNYGRPTKIINTTDFDIRHIDRKLFIDPYVWDFDADHNRRYYTNTQNGIHLMDKVRKDEDLDGAICRVLREEFRVADDYIGASIWGLEFDRDREQQLTPRLKINVFVSGMAQRQRSQSHDWVSI